MHAAAHGLITLPLANAPATAALREMPSTHSRWQTFTGNSDRLLSKPKCRIQIHRMKTLVSITLIVVGGVLVAFPLGASQWQVRRAAEFYEQHGGGSLLPEEMRPRPYAGYDWAALACGALMVLAGGWGSRAARPEPQAWGHP